MAGAEAKAALVKGPLLSTSVAGTPEQMDGVGGILNTGASQSIAIPERFRGGFVSLQCVGASCQFGFSRAPAAPTIVQNQASTFGTTNAARGYTLPQEVERSYQIPDGVNWLTWISSSAAGNLEIYFSEVLALLR
jgi:hypothetical protein